ncbi:MAG: hypothetical protein GY928_05760 [Colwellia sp.]|nr:hypothetical protein [Colwellia sp.]
MKVCNMKEFSQRWDDKLNLLMDKGDIVKICKHTITFKLKGTPVDKPYLFFWKRQMETSTLYTVWLGNKRSNYGELERVNGEAIPSYLQYAPSQETLDRLLELENEVRYPLVLEAYGG